MKRTTTSLTFVLLLAGMLFLGIPSVQAGTCNNATLNTTFGVIISDGLNFNPDGTVTNFVLVGTATFDGHGNISGGTSESFSGSIEQGITFAGTYTVNPDCTGSITITGTHPGTNDGVLPARTDLHHIDMVIADNAKEVLIIFVDPGNVIAGTMKRQ